VPKSKLKSVRALPWGIALQAGLVARERWQSLSKRDRERLARLTRDSRGRLSNLSAKEREELRKLLGKLDIKQMGRDLLPLAGARKRRRRKR
jgi:hypothetical protein